MSVQNFSSLAGLEVGGHHLVVIVAADFQAKFNLSYREKQAHIHAMANQRSGKPNIRGMGCTNKQQTPGIEVTQKFELIYFFGWRGWPGGWRKWN